MMRLLLIFLMMSSTGLSQVSMLSGQDTARRPIITAVPFLMISPDSRGSAMGETGVATDADVNSIHWNNAKLAFIDKKYGFGLSYVPWLGKIVDDMSISYLTGFYKIDKVQTVGVSMKYFDLGEIQLTDNQGMSMGVENPKELSTAFTYSRKLTNSLSLGGTARYIWSNLSGSISNYSDAKAGTSFSVDLGLYYNKEINISGRTSELSFGSHISNIGGKITYGSSKNLDFIPTNMRFGSSLKTFIDQFNSITLAIDFNKLMVPSPPLYELDNNGNFIINPNTNQPTILKGKDPNRSVLSGIFSSFSDAPDGFSEELKEITISSGLEYWYRDVFALRGGYFFENINKGGRKFLTLGAGLKYNNLGLDFSYLSTIENDHPLAETMRFSISFIFDKEENFEDLSNQ